MKRANLARAAFHVVGFTVNFTTAMLLAYCPACLSAEKATTPTAPYQSPYSVAYSFSRDELMGDILSGTRGAVRDESSIPYHDWYSRHVERRYGVWGPPAKHYPPPVGLAGRSLAWRRERVIAVAMRFQNYDYQHHHIPDWNPPASWPWKEVHTGHNGRGVDCSNFSAFVYNLALGIKPSGGVEHQGEELKIPGPGKHNVTRAQRIERPATFAQLVATLQTGDLLYTRHEDGRLGHVMIWVGALGRAPDGLPLVIDCEGPNVVDSQGNKIPGGVHLRPYREHSWHYRELSHALRILHEDPSTSR